MARQVGELCSDPFVWVARSQKGTHIGFFAFAKTLAFDFVASPLTCKEIGVGLRLGWQEDCNGCNSTRELAFTCDNVTSDPMLLSVPASLAPRSVGWASKRRKSNSSEVYFVNYCV